MPGLDRITQLRINGLRTIRRMSLDLKAITVLIGDNGTGKSSILEALELLSQAAQPVTYLSDVIATRHGGLPCLLRRGANEMHLGVTIEGAGPRLDYDFTIGTIGQTPQILNERLSVSGEPGPPQQPLIRAGASDARLLDAHGRSTAVPVDGRTLALTQSIRTRMQAHPAVLRALDALTRLEVHVRHGPGGRSCVPDGRRKPRPCRMTR